MTAVILNFFYMSGYGFYIWTAYACVCTFLITHWLLPWRRWRNYVAEQKQSHE